MTVIGAWLPNGWLHVEWEQGFDMVWTCCDCGNQVVRSRRPAACRFCGPDAVFVPATTVSDTTEPGSEGMFGRWLEVGLDRADLSNDVR